MAPKRDPTKFNNKNKPLGSGTISHARRLKRQQKYGQPWSSSDWWQSSSWNENPSSSSTGWQQAEDSYQWQDQSQYSQVSWVKEEPDDTRMDVEPSDSRPSRGTHAPVTPPWKKADSEDEDDIRRPPPSSVPAPDKLLHVRAELSSSSNSEDWGKQWRVKHQKDLSDDSILLQGPLHDAELEKAERGDDDDDEDDAAMPSIPGMHLYPKVGIDWHNTLEVNGVVDEASLERLIRKGVQCSILSYCFKKRARTFIEQANSLRSSIDLERIEVTEARTGPGGKCDLYEQWCVDVLFDDAQDICQEGLEKGLHVYPICTQFNHHQWYKDLGHQPYASFAEAVDDFFRTYGPGA
jgi:hypothetical protein